MAGFRERFACLVLSPGAGSQARATFQAVPPTNFHGVAQSTTSIQWSWDPSTGASFYELHADPDPVSGPPTVIATFITATNFQETGLAENTQYARHVHASGGGVLGSPSNADQRYTLIHTATSADFTVTADSSTAVSIAVVPPSNSMAGQTGVEVIRTVPTAAVVSPFSQVYTVTDSGLQPDTEFCYNIQFRNGDGIPSGFSPTSLCARTPVQTVEVCPKPVFKVELEYKVLVTAPNGKTGQRTTTETVNVDGDDATLTFTPENKQAPVFGTFPLKKKDSEKDDEVCLCWTCYFPDGNGKNEFNAKQGDISAAVKDPKSIIVQCGTGFLWVACKFKHAEAEKNRNCAESFTWVQLIQQSNTGDVEEVRRPAEGNKPEIKDQFSFTDFRVDVGPCTLLNSPAGYPDSCRPRIFATLERAIHSVPKAKERNGQECKFFLDFPQLAADAGPGAPDVAKTLNQHFQTFLVSLKPLVKIVRQVKWEQDVALSVTGGTPTCDLRNRKIEVVSPIDLTQYKATLTTFFTGVKNADDLLSGLGAK